MFITKNKLNFGFLCANYSELTTLRLALLKEKLRDFRLHFLETKAGIPGRAHPSTAAQSSGGNWAKGRGRLRRKFHLEKSGIKAKTYQK